MNKKEEGHKDFCENKKENQCYCFKKQRSKLQFQDNLMDSIFFPASF